MEVEVSSIERYVPLIIYVVVALTLCIGLKIIGYGYLPQGVLCDMQPRPGGKP
jgi:hypothetical protein